MEPRPQDPAIRRFRLRLLMVLAAALALPIGLAVLYHYPPSEYSFYPRCPFNQVTGLHCPGCGLTRCLHALVHGDVPQAFAWHPLLLVMGLPLLLWWGGKAFYHWWRPTAPRIPPMPVWARYVSIGVLVAFWILRNLDVSPFLLLAPHRLD